MAARRRAGAVQPGEPRLRRDGLRQPHHRGRPRRDRRHRGHAHPVRLPRSAGHGDRYRAELRDARDRPPGQRSDPSRARLRARVPGGRPVSTLRRPHSSSRRAALLEQLVVALTSGEGGTPSLPIRTRAPDDPTIALLDAWATVGDVLGFYLDRIADEGYLTTAIQPGSILALASLVGYQPVPGLAAQTYLAYTLAPDPADGAVQFSPGLLFQSVPGPGQQPQTFESAGALVARPSWNLLSPKSTRPLPASPTSLVVGSTSTGLSPNDVILLEVAAGGTPKVDYVASATVDYTAQVTNVTLQGASPASTSTSQPTDATTAIDGLLTGNLGKPTNPVPGSANQLTQTAESVFSPGSDTVPRLISVLQPAVAP